MALCACAKGVCLRQGDGATCRQILKEALAASTQDRASGGGILQFGHQGRTGLGGVPSVVTAHLPPLANSGLDLHNGDFNDDALPQGKG